MSWHRVEKKPVKVHALELEERLEIQTREGTVVGYPGDYLMVGVEGEVYPCGEEIFAKTYDVVEEVDGPEPTEFPGVRKA